MKGENGRNGAMTLLRKLLTRSAIPIVLLAGWLMATTWGHVPVILLPKPSAVWQDTIHYLRTGELLMQVEVSLYRCFTGFFTGSLLGIAAGVLIGWLKWLDDLFGGIINFIRSIPKTALAPLFIVWFGFGDLPKILLISMAAFFYTIIPTIEGVENVDVLLIKSARSMGAKQSQILFRVVLPAALPSIYAGIRIAATSSFVVLVFVEIISGSNGLGFLLQDAQERLNTSTMFMTLIVIGILGFCLDGLVRYSEKMIMPWRKGRTITR